MNSETVIALCSMVIATISLVAAIWSSVAQRKHNILSVRPYLDINIELFAGKPIRYYVKNCGLGPAFIESLYVILDGKKSKMDSLESYHAIGSRMGNGFENSLDYCYVTHGDGAIIHGEFIDIMRFMIEDSKEAVEKSLKNAPRIGIEMEYKCSYGKKYKADFSWHKKCS